jgi:hypothetical protein
VVAASTASRIGVVVVRTWLEPGHRQVLRARIVATDFTTAEPTVMAAGSAVEIARMVEEWVKHFAEH